MGSIAYWWHRAIIFISVLSDEESRIKWFNGEPVAIVEIPEDHEELISGPKVRAICDALGIDHKLFQEDCAEHTKGKI